MSVSTTAGSPRPAPVELPSAATVGLLDARGSVVTPGVLAGPVAVLAAADVPGPLGVVTLQVTTSGHRVALDGIPVETLTRGCGQDLDRRRFDLELDTPAGAWHVHGSLDEHSPFSLRYVVAQLQDVAGGLVVRYQHHPRALSVLVAHAAGWSSWHAAPGCDGEPPRLLRTTTLLAAACRACPSS